MVRSKNQTNSEVERHRELVVVCFAVVIVVYKIVVFIVFAVIVVLHAGIVVSLGCVAVVVV